MLCGQLCGSSLDGSGQFVDGSGRLLWVAQGLRPRRLLADSVFRGQVLGGSGRLWGGFGMILNTDEEL